MGDVEHMPQGRPGRTPIDPKCEEDAVRRLLAVARVMKGWGQKQTAARIGFSQALYSSIEAGHAQLHPKWVVPTAAALDIDAGTLWAAVVGVYRLKIEHDALRHGLPMQALEAQQEQEIRAEISALRAEVAALRAKGKARRLSDAGDRRDWDACDAIEAERPDSEREQAATVRHVWGACEDVEAP